LGGRGRQISEFEASLVYSEFQDSQGYTEKPKKKKKKRRSSGVCSKPVSEVLNSSPHEPDSLEFSN
jgi:hypothetical protein